MHQKLSLCGFTEVGKPSKGLKENEEITDFWLCTMPRITSPGFTEEFRRFDTQIIFRQLVTSKED